MADAEAPPARVDAQDPLPEGQWFWRRVFVFIVTSGLAWFIWREAERISIATMADTTQAHLEITKWSLLLLWFVITYYLIAPSAEQVTRMWQTANVLKAGVSMATSKSATAADGSTASAQTLAGPGVGTTGTAAGNVDLPSEVGLPGILQGDPPDPLEEAPPANPELPEEPSWRA